MKPELQRIAIAKACGWTRRPDLDYHNNFGHMHVYDRDGYCRDQLSLPDYLNDLNAMHEAERILGQKQRDWVFHLCNVTDGNLKLDSCVHYADVSAIAHATASQRAECFLRTIGKWDQTDATLPSVLGVTPIPNSPLPLQADPKSGGEV